MLKDSLKTALNGIAEHALQNYLLKGSTFDSSRNYLPIHIFSESKWKKNYSIPSSLYFFVSSHHLMASELIRVADLSANLGLKMSNAKAMTIKNAKYAINPSKAACQPPNPQYFFES